MTVCMRGHRDMGTGKRDAISKSDRYEGSKISIAQHNHKYVLMPTPTSSPSVQSLLDHIFFDPPAILRSGNSIIFLVVYKSISDVPWITAVV